MKIIGLTGSIGSGKSFVGDIFKKLDIPVFDADEEIHKLMYSGGEAVVPVAEQFPEALTQAMEIDRGYLGEIVFNDPEKLARLESILHPLVRKKGEEFLKKAQAKGVEAIVQDIPLLFETGADRICDIVIVVSISKKLQKKRVMKRDGMTEEKFEAIREQQLSNKKKEAMADYVIDGNADKSEIKKQLEKILRDIKEK